MEQKDIIVIAIAFIIVLFLALIVKPMLTGEDPKIGIPDFLSKQEGAQSQSTVETESIQAQQSNELASNQPSEGSVDNSPTEIEREVGPTLTPGQEDTSKISWQPDPDMPMPAIQMIDYASIIGKYSGSSAPFRIPTPYWELHYNISETTNNSVFSIDIIEENGDENKTIRTITWKQGKEADPKEGRFFEGGQNYILNITAKDIAEYKIMIKIPLKYIKDT